MGYRDPGLGSECVCRPYAPKPVKIQTEKKSNLQDRVLVQGVNLSYHNRDL